MGCGSSNGADDPSNDKVNWNDAEIDEEFKKEENNINSKRKVFDKSQNKMVEIDAP
eukprot:CAMPEP_0197008726 /NCGR_PEP_ID=MMETSP1380-20130617/46643_1 /TAXON_ID=5936 /ORGANISM="Euplotes crassus, Strain CT5" /LENGTH=55 /DNA_ID=CAMNT_0042429499 /DNA_START=53 /DNA_END=217 /DNA_ORIENTATION=+